MHNNGQKQCENKVNVRLILAKIVEKLAKIVEKLAKIVEKLAKIVHQHKPLIVDNCMTNLY